MNLRRWLVRVAVGAALLGLAGCGETSPPAVPPSPPPGNGLPARPATLRIEGVDPCALLTPAQYSQLRVDAGRRNDYEPDRPLQGTACDWSTDKPGQRIGYGASLVTNRGAEFALGAEPPRAVDGYAVTTTGSAFQDPRWYCIALVDVAPGQSLLADYGNDTHDLPGMTHEKACDLAQKAAEFMLGNLRALQR